MDHLMRHGAGKKDHEIRVAYLSLKATLHLGEDLCLTLVFLTKIDILSDHTVIAAYDDYTHLHPFLVLRSRSSRRRISC